MVPTQPKEASGSVGALLSRNPAWPHLSGCPAVPCVSCRFGDPLESDTISVVAFHSPHRVSTCRILTPLPEQQIHGTGAGPEKWLPEAETEAGGTATPIQATGTIR